METDFAEVLREYRETAGLTQHALARAAGIHPSNLNRLEGGHQRPRRATVLKLIQGLGWTLTDERAERLLAAARVESELDDQHLAAVDPELRRAVGEMRRSLLGALEQLDRIEERLDTVDAPEDAAPARRPETE